MKLTIESMTYGADGLAHADNGKAVFVQGAVAGDTVEAEVVQDGKSFMRARTTEILEPSPDRIQPPCPFVGICGGCSWGNLLRTAQLAAKEQNLRSTLERIGKFAPEQVDELVQPIRHTKDDWGYRNKIELEPTVVNGRVRLGMHGVDPSKIVTVDACPLFDKRFPKALKSVVGALNYLSGSHDLGLERVGIRASRRTKALEVALWTPTGSFPRSQVSRVLADAAHPTSIVRVMSKGEKKARRVSKVEMLAGEGSWTENIAEGQMRLSAPSFFQVNTKGAEILIELVMEALGGGDLCMIDNEGGYSVAKTSSRMKRYTRKASQASGVSIGSASMLWKSGVSSYAINHGLQAMHLAGMEGSKPAFFGDKEDVIENVDEGLLRERVDFVMELLKSI